MIWGDASFLLLLVGSADLNMFCSSSFSHHIAFYSFVFMHKISTLVVCFTNVEHPRSTLHFLTRFQYPFFLQSFVCHYGTCLIAIDSAYIGVVFVFWFVLLFFCIESSSVSICQQAFLSKKRGVLPQHQKAKRRCIAFLLLYASAVSVSKTRRAFVLSTV